jgi:hypothetical protein
MRFSLFLLSLFFFGCKKEVDQVNNRVYRYSLSEYTGPDVGWKTIKADTVSDLIDDGIEFKSVDGNYSVTIYQGAHKFWPTKNDYVFEATYINDTTFKIGNDQNGYSIAYFNSAWETLTIIERTPVNGRKHVYNKVSY